LLKKHFIFYHKKHKEKYFIVLSFYRFIVLSFPRSGVGMQPVTLQHHTTPNISGNGPLLEQLKKVIINASSVSAGIKHRVMQ
jgi:hypothetical protein